MRRMMMLGKIRGSARILRRIELRQAVAGIALMSGLAACSGPPQVSARAPAQPVANLSQADTSSYEPPGPPGDPWGPYIHEASTRFTVPEKWIREVMRQESGGKQYISGGLTTSSVGAMGLMQLMPVTYAQERDRYGLGNDPYAPHDNIMAGTAYIGEMYARYGSPGFLAAYNAGPGRLDSYLVGGTPLPHETVGYLASIAPRLGDAQAPTGPLAHYARAETSADDLNARSLNGTLAAARPAPAPMVQLASYQPSAAPSGYQPSVAATGDLGVEMAAHNSRTVESSPLAAYAPPPPKPVVQQARQVVPSAPPAAHVVLASATSLPATGFVGGGWVIQVGAFSSQAQASAAATAAKSRAHGALDRARANVAAVPRAGAPVVYRAQLVGLSADAANEACGRLAHEHVACLVVAPKGEL